MRIVHTFWGLEVLHEEHSKSLKLSSVSNPNIPVPNAVAALPGIDRVTTRRVERRIADNGTATIEELLETSLGMGVGFQTCRMTIDLMNYGEDSLYVGCRRGHEAAGDVGCGQPAAGLIASSAR